MSPSNPHSLSIRYILLILWTSAPGSVLSEVCLEVSFEGILLKRVSLTIKCFLPSKLIVCLLMTISAFYGFVCKWFWLHILLPSVIGLLYLLFQMHSMSLLFNVSYVLLSAFDIFKVDQKISELGYICIWSGFLCLWRWWSYSVLVSFFSNIQSYCLMCDLCFCISLAAPGVVILIGRSALNATSATPINLATLKVVLGTLLSMLILFFLGGELILMTMTYPAVEGF